MRRTCLLILLTLSASIAACGGNDTKEVDCEAGLEYQNRIVGRRVVTPEDLDDLDAFKEMPIPSAAEDVPKPAPGKCADMPPVIRPGS